MAVEYEYSYKVKNLKPFIDYCEKNNYEFVSENKQVRTLYKNVNKIMARITKKINNGIEKTVLDFKDDNLNDEVLNVSRETIPLEVTSDNEEAIFSILDMLEYKKDKVLERTRYVYEKNQVTFELDEYTSPEVMCVVAVEGEKEEVDKVYDEIKDLGERIE